MTIVKTSDKSLFAIRSADGKKFLQIAGDPIKHIIERTQAPAGHSYIWYVWSKSAERTPYPIDLDSYQRDVIIDIARERWRRELKERRDTLDNEIDELDQIRKKMDALTKGKLMPPMPQKTVRGWSRLFYRSAELPEVSTWVDATGADESWIAHTSEMIESDIQAIQYRIRLSRKEVNALERYLNDPIEWVRIEIHTEITTDITVV